jgi:hypothetical protein
MTHEDRGHYAGKHPADRPLNPAVVEAVRNRAVDKEISCNAAFEIAAELGVPPGEIGFTLDMLEIRIVRCQLGLFGYGPRKKVIKPAASVSPELEAAIRQALTHGRLPCKNAWEIAERFDIAKMQVSSACEVLNIKISPCQLGPF